MVVNIMLSIHSNCFTHVDAAVIRKSKRKERNERLFATFGTATVMELIFSLKEQVPKNHVRHRAHYHIGSGH